MVLADGTVRSPSSPGGRWSCPSIPPCEANQEGCRNPGALRLRPCFNDDPPLPHCNDLRALLLNQTSSAWPCKFERANAQVTGRSWTSCAAMLGLDNPRLWSDSNVLNGMSFMFNNNIPREAVVVGGGRDPAPVVVTGTRDLAGAALCAFSFGSGYICPDFAGCEQPGLTNTALAATAIGALPHLAGEAGAGTTHFLMQWETAAAAAELLGLDRESFVGNANLSSSCTAHSAGEVCVWKVGDGGTYLGTNDVYRIIAGKISELGISKLVQLAAPDHLPRVYRTGLRYLLDTQDRVTLYPAMIPYTHNFPVSSQAAIVNLYAGGPFLQGPNYGLYPDNPQPWVRNRVVFRLYEFMAYVWGGGSGIYHVPTREAPSLPAAGRLHKVGTRSAGRRLAHGNMTA